MENEVESQVIGCLVRTSDNVECLVEKVQKLCFKLDTLISDLVAREKYEKI